MICPNPKCGTVMHTVQQAVVTDTLYQCPECGQSTLAVADKEPIDLTKALEALRREARKIEALG